MCVCVCLCACVCVCVCVCVYVSAEVRRLRLQYKQGRISRDAYERAIASHIGYSVGVQEALGLDVLVHGESERTDMVG